jgi:DNA-binding transcriptional LysR family regulator
MNLEYLNTFINVIKIGSFSEAARRLYISQPAISAQIQKLEQELGVRLINRGKSGISMTRAGEILYRFAENVYDERSIMLRELDQLREETTGELIITTSPVLGEFILPGIISEFREDYSLVVVNLLISDSLKVIEEVKNGIYEIGFCSIKTESQELEFFKIAEDNIVLIVYPGHLFSSRKEISLDELRGESLILRDAAGKKAGDTYLLMQAGLDLNQCKLKLIMGTIMGVITSVEARVGIAFLPFSSVKQAESLGLVKVIKVKGNTLKREYYCVYRKEKVVSRIADKFIEYIRQDHHHLRQSLHKAW